MTPIRRLIAASLAIVAAPPLHAQTIWPDKPVRLIVPLPPGGPSDIVLRAAIEKMQPMLWSTNTLVTVNPHVYRKLGFKPSDRRP